MSKEDVPFKQQRQTILFQCECVSKLGHSPETQQERAVECENQCIFQKKKLILRYVHVRFLDSHLGFQDMVSCQEGPLANACESETNQDDKFTQNFGRECQGDLHKLLPRNFNPLAPSKNSSDLFIPFLSPQYLVFLWGGGKKSLLKPPLGVAYLVNPLKGNDGTQFVHGSLHYQPKQCTIIFGYPLKTASNI